MAEQFRITVPVASVLAEFLDDPQADRYGLELMRGTGLPSGTLYPVLARLQQAGWVAAHWEQIDPTEAGRPARRYYRLTPQGVIDARAALAALHARTGVRRPSGGGLAPRPALRSLPGPA